MVAWRKQRRQAAVLTDPTVFPGRQDVEGQCQTLREPSSRPNLSNVIQLLPFKRDLLKLGLLHVIDHLLLRATAAKTSTGEIIRSVFSDVQKLQFDRGSMMRVFST